MNRLLLLSLLACFLLVSTSLPVAAEPAKMQIEVKVEDPDTFWNCSYYTKEKTPTKPVEIKLEWSTDSFAKPTIISLVAPKKDQGKYSLNSDKDLPVNLRVFITGPKGEILSSWNMQVLNKGQTEIITIFPPATVQPEFDRS